MKAKSGQSPVEATTLNGAQYVEFLQQILCDQTRPLIIIADQASFQPSLAVHEFVRTHRTQLWWFFFRIPSPELNPDEQIWNELKPRQLGKHLIKNKTDLKKQMRSILKSLQRQAEKARSFFQLPDTKYATIPRIISNITSGYQLARPYSRSLIHTCSILFLT